MNAARVRRTSLVLVVSVVLSGCRQSEPPRGPAFSAQSLDQIYFGPPAIPGVDGPLAQTQPETPGEPWTLGPPIVVSTEELMARGSGVARDRANAPRLNKIRPDRSLLPDNPASRPFAQWPTSPFFRDGGPAAAFVPGTPNVNVAFLADTGGSLPPDTMGDVGPTQYVVALNGRVRAVSKATGAIDPAFDLDSDVFYGAAGDGRPTGDPRVRYDRRAGRWYILMFNIAVPNRYLLAVSDTSTITGSTIWSIYFWNNTRTQGGVGGAAGCLGDYPTLGVDEDALYIGANQFCGSSLNTVTFDSVSVYVLPSANLLAGSPVVVQFDAVLPNGSSAGPFTAHGVDNFDNNTNEGYFIGVDNATFGTLMLRRVINPATSTPSLSGNVPITVPTTTLPIVVPQPGAAKPLDGIDDRLMNAVIRNGRLWTIHTNQVNASGASVAGGGRNGERWYEISNLSGAPSVVQSGTVFDSAATSPTSHWMGSIMVNGQGHAALGASRGGAATFVNTEFTGRLAGATPGTMETPTQYSNNTSTLYNIQPTATRQRWGDYSYTSVDPTDDMTMWTLQEYPTAVNNYAVRLIRLQAPPPAAIASLSPNSVATGQSGVTVTVTGTSSAGSGFFDPGAGFLNRIAAAFSGTGVTVTGIAFNSPTSLTLTLSTVGAATGARTLTVTNPDGQQASLPSALTITGGVTPPVAVNDSYDTPFNTALNVAAPGVLGNDNANGGGAMTAALVSGPASGTVSLNANGSFGYTPASGFTGPVTFTYQASNANGSSNVATVTVTVNPPGAPTAANDSYSTPFNTALNVAAPGVLGNDNANGGGTMTATLNAGPASGTLSLNANGSFTFTPATGFTGPVAFTYRANTTAGGQSAPATVTISVGQAPPTTVGDSYATPFQTALNVAAPGVLGNDNSNGGGAMTAVLVTTTANGTLSLAASGGFVYSPNSGFSGTDSFTYRASTTAGLGNIVTVAIAVAAPPVPPPTAVNDSYTTPFGTALNVAAPGVLGNDNSNGGGALSAVLATTTVNGVLSLSANGGFAYTPNSGFSGTDSFTYRASNVSGPGNLATVSITVGVAPPGPLPPTNLRIIGMTGNNVTLAWVLPTSGATPTALRLEGGMTPGSMLGELPLGVTPAATVTLPTGSFYLRLRTIAGSAVSGPSNEILAHIDVPVTPSAPSNLLGLVTGSGLNLAWTPTFAGSAATGAILDVSGALTLSVPLGPSETFSHSPVAPGTYTFRIRQTNGGGASAASPPVTLTFPGGCSGAPQVPTDVVIFKSGGMVNMYWSPPASGGAPTGYAVTVSGSFVGTVPVAGRSLIAAAAPGTYSLAVVANNPCGTSAPSAAQTLSFP